MKTKVIAGNRVLLTDPSQYLESYSIALHLKELIGRCVDFAHLNVRSRKPKLRSFILDALGVPTEKIADSAHHAALQPPAVRLDWYQQLIKITSCTIQDNGSINFQPWAFDPLGVELIYSYTDPTGAQYEFKMADIRFIIVVLQTSSIHSILVMSGPEIQTYIKSFGLAKTSKYQLFLQKALISEMQGHSDPVLVLGHDSFKPGPDPLEKKLRHIANLPPESFRNLADYELLLSLREIGVVASSLIGRRISVGTDKQRGQEFERMLLEAMGYKVGRIQEGFYPDIRHQSIESKAQQSPTIDLGAFSPAVPTVIDDTGRTSLDVRYVIALLNEQLIIYAIVVATGAAIVNDTFRFRLDGKQNVKRQNGISASILSQLAGGIVYLQGGMLQKLWPDGKHQILTIKDNP